MYSTPRRSVATDLSLCVHPTFTFYMLTARTNGPQIQRKPARFPDAIPHLEQWQALRALCWEGCLFTASKLRLRPFSSSSTGRKSGSGLWASGAGSSTLLNSSSQGSKKKKRTKSEQPSREAPKTAGGATSDIEVPSPARVVLGDTQGLSKSGETAGAAAAAARSTAAGSGGRWIHLS